MSELAEHVEDANWAGPSDDIDCDCGGRLPGHTDMGLGHWSCGCYIDAGPYSTGSGEDDWDSGPYLVRCQQSRSLDEEHH